MSSVISTSEQSTTTKPQRVLACVLCQQRKIKCDRKQPCASCIRSRVQCVPVSLASRQRRRRFPERVLLNRLRHYEDLLRQNNITFEPLHTTNVERPIPSDDGRSSDTVDNAPAERVVPEADRPPKRQATIKSKAMNLWHAMHQQVPPSPRRSKDHADNYRKTLDRDDGDEDFDSDDIGDGTYDNEDAPETVMKKAWDQYEGESNDQFLFGSPSANVDISTLHPKPGQMFRLWQIYLDNVNPLLKITHTPTLQALIIETASDVTDISPTSEALVFGIYCVAILSLTDDGCCTFFGSTRKDLLTSYQFGCQQAMRNCRILRSGDRNSLTALYLYLVSVRPKTDPRSLSSMLAIAIRLAQRIGIDNESTNAKCTALEAEMRRRLWWSLAFFDNRICEMSDHRTATLAPTWDCTIPLNVNDFEIRPEMKSLPKSHEEPTEAIFTVVRSELADFVRHSAFHLDFINPSLKAVANDARYGPALQVGELSAMEKRIEGTYLASCNPENPLHCMTIWTTRVYFAKNRLLEHCWRYSTPAVQPTTTQRNAAIDQALDMLEADTKLMTSPLTKGYLWLIDLHFPLPAYIFILQDGRKRPAEDHTERAWAIMSDNYQARTFDAKHDEKPFFMVFSQIVLRTWEAREALFKQQGRPLEPPRIVSDIRKKGMEMASNGNMEQPEVDTRVTVDQLPMEPAEHGPLYGAGEGPPTGLWPWGYSEQMAVPHVDWATMDWDTMHL